MDVRGLRNLVAVARLGSFTKAAEHLRIAQPALSVSIKKLEEELDAPLLLRKARRVEPTVEGAILIAHAERIFSEMDSAVNAIADAAELRTGTVRIGMPPMYGFVYFPDVIARFRATYPGIDLELTEGSAEDIGHLLDTGGIDLAMLEQRRVRSEWNNVFLGEEEMVLCVAKGHPLEKRTSIRPQDLDKLPMALFSASFIQRSLVNKFCKTADAKPRVVLQSNSVPIIRRAAVDRLGAATLLRSLAAAPPKLVAISFEPKEILRFMLCWRDDRYLSKANQAFVRFSTGSA
jgi:LysR family transcriptional regulator, cyn operon transcriptional activator